MKVGIYIRGLTLKNDPYKMANRLIDNGINFATFLIYWQESNKNKKINSKYLSEYVKVFDAHGIDCSVWGYPWCGKEQSFIDRFKWARDECDGRLCSFDLDPERGYQGHVVGRKEAQYGATKLIDGMLDIMNENLDIKITSFGAAHFHTTFPWKEFCCGVGSPQFYLEDRKQVIKAGLKKWKNVGFTEIMPSVPLFGKNSGKQLPKYLETIKTFCMDLQIPTTGWIFWSYRQLDSIELSIIKNL